MIDMTAKEMATELMKTPTAQVVVRLGTDWIEVIGIEPTGVHRNAVTIRAADPRLDDWANVIKPDAEGDAK